MPCSLAVTEHGCVMTSVRMTQVFFHGPRALFNMNDDFGGDTVIRSNLFFKSLLGAVPHNTD